MLERYLDSTGAECWVVYVNIRSQHSGLRIQRKTKGIKTEAQAKKLELQLIRECERELLIKESKGISWNELLEKFEDEKSSLSWPKATDDSIAINEKNSVFIKYV